MAYPGYEGGGCWIRRAQILGRAHQFTQKVEVRRVLARLAEVRCDTSHSFLSTYLRAGKFIATFFNCFRSKPMIESSQGGAESVSSEFQPYRMLYIARAKGGARAPCAPPPCIRH